MSTIRLPRYLPFAQYHRVGLPYHGLVSGLDSNKDGTLTLPDATTMVYPQAINGDVIVVRGQDNSATAEEVDGNYRWRNYALLSGNTRRIGGADLGPFHWIYSDAGHSWLVSLEYGQPAGSAEITLSVYLDDIFGYFSDADLTMERKLLDSFSYTPKLYNGTNAPAPSIGSGADAYCLGRYLSHSADGAISIINLAGPARWPETDVHIHRIGYGWISTTFTTAEEEMAEITADDHQGSSLLGIHSAVKIIVSGNGSTIPGSVGSGISATIAMQRTAPEMLQTASIERTAYSYQITYWYPPPFDSPTHFIYEMSQTFNAQVTVRFLDTVQTDGSIVSVASTKRLDYDQYVNWDNFYNTGISESTAEWSYSLTAGGISWSDTQVVYGYFNSFGDEIETVNTFTEGGVTFDTATGALSVPMLSVVADRKSSTASAELPSNYITQLYGAYPLAYYQTNDQKLYSGLVFFCRALEGSRDDSFRKSLLVSLAGGLSETVDKLTGQLIHAHSLSGANCSHDPVTGEFSYDLSIGPNLVTPLYDKDDTNNNTQRSHV